LGAESDLSGTALAAGATGLLAESVSAAFSAGAAPAFWFEGSCFAVENDLKDMWRSLFVWHQIFGALLDMG